MTAAALVVLAAVASLGCGTRSVDAEQRLIEVHGDRLYLCLIDAINASDPPSCGADIGTTENPELHGRSVPELVELLADRNEFVEVSAVEQDGKWFLQGYRAPVE